VQTFKAYRTFEQDKVVSSRFVDMSLDELDAGDVVIRTKYSTINYKDALSYGGAGKIMRKFPTVAGIDMAGTVESSKDPRWKRGDKVIVTGYDLGVSHDGGFSALARVPGDWVVPLPPGLSMAEAMSIGTAGFTAALSIVEMERNGLTPGNGPVVVTGATGGVGCMAVQSLAARGYEVTALTGKPAETDFLRAIGATTVLDRRELQMGTKPLEKASWSGAVDAVGGETLAWLTRTMQYRGCIASSGLAGGHELHTTVMPFILRGVKLLGIDSALCPMPLRAEAWHRLANDLKPPHLAMTTTEIGFDRLPNAFDTLLAGRARGRFLVRLP